MAEIIHYDAANGRTECSKKITSKIKVATQWSKVTCSDCKQISNNSWRGMTG